MDVRDEIVRRVDKLPPEMQDQVLRFVASFDSVDTEGRERGGVASGSFLLDTDVVIASFKAGPGTSPKVSAADSGPGIGIAAATLRRSLP